MPGVDSTKALNVKREALLDLVYSYTESRPAKGALQYFEKLSESRTTYALALDKLGNRYFIKQQYEFAIPALRKLMEVQPDPELEVERGREDLRLAQGGEEQGAAASRKTSRSSCAPRSDRRRTREGRADAQEDARRARRDGARPVDHASRRGAEARRQGALPRGRRGLRELPGLFRPKQYATMIMQNRADALFAAKQYRVGPAVRRARAVPRRGQGQEGLDKDARRRPTRTRSTSKDQGREETLGGPRKGVKNASSPRSRRCRRRVDADGGDVKNHEEALYGALLSHYSSLKPGDVERLNAFEVADARQALKLLGAEYVSRYPTSEHVLEVKFNIARAYYEDGDYPKAASCSTTSRRAPRAQRRGHGGQPGARLRSARSTTSRASKRPAKRS